MLKKTLLIAIVVLGFVCLSSAQPLPNIHIIATGGTIAGVGQSATAGHYKPSQLGVQDLILAVPQINTIANVTGEQIFKVSSQDLTDEHHLSLSRRVNDLLSNDSIDAIVITHGTDTMEETAYFLQLTTHSDKPIVLTGSMRASTSLSADGPMNLFNAVVTAASKDSKCRDVMIVTNGDILSARDASKSHTTAVQTFVSPNTGPIGTVFDGKASFNQNHTNTQRLAHPFDITNVKTLPKVGIVYSHAGVLPTAVEAMIKEKYQGIVHSGVGNGNIHQAVLPSLAKASDEGILVVRSSRIASGSTTQPGEIDDKQYGFVASGTLSPQKARILLALALTQTKDYKRIQQMFNIY